MRRHPSSAPVFLLGLAIAMAASAGCATRRYVGPTTGRAADMQTAVSRALDNAAASLSFGKYAGKTCHLEVFSLAENYGGESPENAVIRGVFAERLSGDGVPLSADPAVSDIRLSVRARTVGVNMIRRDFPPLYYRETTSAVVDLHASVYSRPDGKLLEQMDVRRRLHLAQSYLFYIIGPFESSEWD